MKYLIYLYTRSPCTTFKLNGLDDENSAMKNAVLPKMVASLDNAVFHSVMILASGLSTRLGYPKQWLSKEGDPLLIYMMKQALATQPQAIIVVIPKGNVAIEKAVNLLTVQTTAITVVVNANPETGMAHSLSLAIDALPHNDTLSNHRVLIMGVDQVLLDSQHLKNLLVGNSSVSASRYRYWDNLAMLKETNESLLGLPLVIDYEQLKPWQTHLEGDKGLRDLIRALPPNQIAHVDNHLLSYDIDTPEQLAYARQQNWLDK